MEIGESWISIIVAFQDILPADAAAAGAAAATGAGATAGAGGAAGGGGGGAGLILALETGLRHIGHSRVPA